MAVDLTTRYLGLTLKNPLVVGASPMTCDLSVLRRLEEAGAAAAVLPSLFQEQIQRDEEEIERLYEYQVDLYGDVVEYVPELNYLNKGAGGYLRFIEECKRELAMPIIASLNGQIRGEWIGHARLVAEAGADALELNIYTVPSDAETTSREVEDQYIDLVAGVRAEISIPLAVKISPYFTALPQFARRLVDAGADGLVLFNRYLASDVDLDKVQIQPYLEFSSPQELRLPLRWISILRDHVTASLAATTGIHDGRDIVKVLLVGADVAMVASILLRHGSQYAQVMLDELSDWLEENGYSSVEEIRGLLSQLEVADPSAVARAHYMKALLSYTEKLR